MFVGWTLAWILGALKLWKICCVGLVEQNHDECGRFVGMCNLWQNFVGMSMEKFCGYGKNFVGMKFWLMEKFCWVCDVDSWKICTVMILAMWEFLCAWTCGNFYLGHVGFFFFAWLWKNLVVVYGYVKNFGCGKIWWHFVEALIFCCGTLTFLGAWGFFGHVGFGHGNW